MPRMTLSVASTVQQRRVMSAATAARKVPKPSSLPIPWSSVKGVLFDIDGTLTDSDDLHFQAFVELLQKPEWMINGNVSLNMCHSSTDNPLELATPLATSCVSLTHQELLQQRGGDRMVQSLFTAYYIVMLFAPLTACRMYAGGEPIDREFFDRHIAGAHNPDITAFLFPHKSEEEQAEFSEVKEAYFRSLAKTELKPIPGLLELLSIVDAKALRKIAVTNAPQKNAELMLRSIGLSDYFEEVVIGSQCTRAKPFPDPYLYGLEKIGLTNDCALVFEDSPAGVTAGVAAGIPVIAVATSQSAERLYDAGCSLVIQDYHDVLELIQGSDATADT